MIIGFSGIDGSGKTTIISNLELSIDYKILHTLSFSRRIKNKSTRIAEYLIATDRAIQYTKIFIFSKILKNNVIMDRCVVDAIVYGKKFKENWLSKLVNKYGFKVANPDIVVWVDTPIETCYNRIKQRKSDKYLDMNDLKRLRELYQEVLECSGLDYLII